MDEYELDRRVTKAVEDIISEIKIPHNILTYAIEPDVDDKYSIPFFVEVNGTFGLIHYFLDVYTYDEDITIKFIFDSVSFRDDEINDENTFKTIVEGINAILDTIDTDMEIYI